MNEATGSALDPKGWDQPKPPPPPRPKRWYQRRWLRLIIIPVVAFAAFRLWDALKPGPDRIKASAAATTPEGYRRVTTRSYELAIPDGWDRKKIDAPTQDRLARQLGDRVAGRVFAASDPGGTSSVDVIPFDAIRGDPSTPSSLRALQQVFAKQYGASLSGAPDVEAVNVHGFPAARVRVDADSSAPDPLTVIVTVIQTGDHVYRVTIASRSGAGAVDLTRKIVPTFEPR